MLTKPPPCERNKLPQTPLAADALQAVSKDGSHNSDPTGLVLLVLIVFQANHTKQVRLLFPRQSTKTAKENIEIYMGEVAVEESCFIDDDPPRFLPDYILYWLVRIMRRVCRSSLLITNKQDQGRGHKKGLFFCEFTQESMIHEKPIHLSRDTWHTRDRRRSRNSHCGKSGIYRFLCGYCLTVNLSVPDCS
jgi:hypothetical protein